MWIWRSSDLKRGLKFFYEHSLWLWCVNITLPYSAVFRINILLLFYRWSFECLCYKCDKTISLNFNLMPSQSRKLLSQFLKPKTLVQFNFLNFRCLSLQNYVEVWFQRIPYISDILRVRTLRKKINISNSRWLKRRLNCNENHITFECFETF